mgnify:FL=1
MLGHLRHLQNYEIVIVCDDSGSMLTPIDDTRRTRWDELRDIVKIILKIGVVFDTNGVDVYFLNREPILRVKDPQMIDQTFENPPRGYAPMVPLLTSIFQSSLAQRGRDKKLLVFIVTDGEPTDDHGNPNVEELKNIMTNIRNAETTYVSFLICTDDAACVEYLNEWDRQMIHVDVTDNFHVERKKVRRYSGQDYRFSHGDYIIKALAGSIVPEIDALNEPSINE